MKFFKVTALAIVAGAGLALVSAQVVRAAESDESSSTYTSSINGNTEDTTIGAGISDTQISATHTEGTAIAAAIATPIGTLAASASLAGGSLGGTGPQSQDSYPPSSFLGIGGYPAAFGSVLDGGSFHASIDNGSSDTFALNHIALWINASTSDTQGSATTSGTNSTGISVAGLFVFGQTIAVPSNGSLTDTEPDAPVVAVNTGDFNGTTGTVAVNQTAGVGNQQGNNLSTLAEVVGSNSVNVEGNQTLAVAGVVGDSYLAGGDSATIASGAFSGITGAVAFNQSAGVANQQVNNLTLAH
jgi:hypothetical protein